jgi:hypothetical protein
MKRRFNKMTITLTTTDPVAGNILQEIARRFGGTTTLQGQSVVFKAPLTNALVSAFSLLPANSIDNSVIDDGSANQSMLICFKS